VDRLVPFDRTALRDEATLVVDVADDLDMQGASVSEFPLDGAQVVVVNARLIS
jgi:hypothetical protein